MGSLLGNASITSRGVGGVGIYRSMFLMTFSVSYGGMDGL